MYRRIAVVFLMELFCFVLQTSVFGAFSQIGVTPALMLVLPVSLGMLHGDVAGLLCGVTSGLFVDVFFGPLIGFHAMLYMYAGFFCGRFYRKFYPENILLPLSVITAADFACGVLTYLLLYAARSKFHILFYLLHVLVPEAVFTLCVSLLLYPLILKLHTALEDYEQRSARKFV